MKGDEVGDLASQLHARGDHLGLASRESDGGVGVPDILSGKPDGSEMFEVSHGDQRAIGVEMGLGFFRSIGQDAGEKGDGAYVEKQLSV